MSETVYLTQGDDGPQINIILRDSNSGDKSDPESWDPIDLSDAATTIFLKFRKTGTTVILQTIECFKVNTGLDGEIFMQWPTDALDVEAGAYEGEIEVNIGGVSLQTVYDKVRFRIRGDF